jgi:predicted Rossmann fold nucleotide-binding protein DprA/Smf involved in DNA uptake
MARERAPEVLPSQPPISGETRADKISGRRPRLSRGAIRVDEVEIQALSLASTIVTPRRTDKLDIKSAPLEPREAFLLELVDGRSSADDLADLTGMTRAEVLTALRRLERLGFLRMGS